MLFNLPLVKLHSFVIHAQRCLYGLRQSFAPIEELRIIYDSTEKELKKLPSDYVYRKEMQEHILKKKNLITQTNDFVYICEQLKIEHIETEIDNAENELSLAKSIVQWGSWNDLETSGIQHQWN